MAGFRAAGWVCCGVLVISLIIAVVGMRGIGIVGQQSDNDNGEKRRTSDIELTAHSATTTIHVPSANPSTLSVNTVVDDRVERAKRGSFKSVPSSGSIPSPA